MEQELNNLNYTIDKIEEVIEDSKLKQKNLRELYKHDYDAMLDEKFRLEKEIESLNKLKLNPYFARIDFKSNENFDKCYIGKKGVIDYDNNIITVDWRAPISSLYYDSNVGRTEYIAPDGIIKGELLLKRQYTIENSKLINFNDVDTVSNDELLKPYLNVSADNRLKNIVSTIQTEQNKIIREKINKNMVIQGVAGSGKTTVALHRIAYLVYNHKDIYKPNDYMVIGPNKFFVNYISKVLPDLDVNGVTQKTLEELIEDYIEEKLTIDNELDTIKEYDETSEFKVSLNMKKEIDEYFKNLKEIPTDDFKINNTKIINKEIIEKIYNDINKENYKSIKSRIERTILLLEKYIKDNQQKILNKLIVEGTDNKTILEIKNNINQHLKKYFTILNTKVKKVYIEILKSLSLPITNINKNIINITDIPSLMYIKYKIFGSEKFNNYRHIVIDEAQDYGIFTFYVLKELFKNSTFSIYGDLAQSLYPYRSINNWEEIDNMYNNFEIIKLNKSYRTTIEIMNNANEINKLLNLDLAQPVIRHGEEVEYFKYDLDELLNKIKDKYNSVAIITKEQIDANNIYEELKEKYEVDLIDKTNLNYNSKINILPSYLSKGLEFDAVIIIDENKFNKNSILDMKLLYVSKTRALHKLFIKN